MKALKIGVLTFHRCINYGSYWQARCLVEGLIARGHNAAILDHESPQVNVAEWKCAYRPVLPTAVPESDYPLYRKKIKNFFRSFDSLPLSPRFGLNDPEQMEDYDMIVVGSDEVWNLFHPWYGGCPLFFGEGLRGKRLVSYAASFGNYDASWQLQPSWSEKLRNFSSISVRDENSQRIVKNAIGIEPALVLDPCLQFPVHLEERAIAEQPYIALYGHNFSPFFVNQILSWATHRNLPLVSIGYRNDWAHEQWITADPHDFAHFMAGAEAVVTNFFHGCVFALRNGKSFVCETTPYRGNKLQGLLSKTGSNKHLVNETTPTATYHHCLNDPLEEQIFRNIRQLQQNSNEYLDQSLSLNHIHQYG
ncbi:MAG: hypothetical protein JWP81_2657 [Ferruginibacter sp.]|nr:hypothetical protein [Ferruginibacter sp.]